MATQITRTQRARLLRRAWLLARTGARFFGGSARSYLGSAMRTAWAEFRRCADWAVMPALATPKSGWAAQVAAAVAFLIPGCLTG